MKGKTRNIWLILGFVLTLILCYQLAISKTIGLKNEFSLLKQHKALLENTPKQISLLKQKQVYYDSLLAKYQLNTGSIQNSLLKTINSYTDSTKLKVIDFLEPHISTVNDLKINTYQFTLEGDYNTIIQLIHTLEQKTKFGEITGLNFEKKTNFKTGKTYLQAHVLLRGFG